jgi:glycosyltransferase involved in cell wall biosynthesis
MSTRKKVLIISYFWPPAGGITVLRCLKIAKYLREYGWEPVVYTADGAQYPYLDPGNLRDVPTGMTVLRHPIREPLEAFKRLSGRKSNDPLSNIVHVRDRKTSWMDALGIWVRGNFFIPDARAMWVNPSVRYLTNWLRDNPVDAIFSDGPPHTNTLIACRVAQATGIPWLADFQDPWTQVDYYKLLRIGPRADRRHKALEQEVFHTAEAITIASPSWKRDLESIGARNVDVLYYGYDDDDFTGLQPARSDRFTLLHAGLLGFDRSPDNVIKALAELARENTEFAESLRVLFYGEVDFGIKTAFAQAGLARQLDTPGTAPRKTVLEAALGAQILLLPLNKADNVQGRVPGKVFEYMRARKPVLGLGPRDSDAAELLHTYQAGAMIDYEDVAGAKAFIRSAWQRWKEDQFKTPTSTSAGTINSGESSESVASDGDFASRGNPPGTQRQGHLPVDISELSNRALTGKVAAILDRISDPQRPVKASTIS